MLLYFMPHYGHVENLYRYSISVRLNNDFSQKIHNAFLVVITKHNLKKQTE
jgi:hypothetical protein